MKVYKFGGASVRNADGVRNLHKIIGEEQHLFIIVSAMGKTTNALERVFAGVQQGDRAAAQEAVDGLRQYHAEIIDDLWHGPTHLASVDGFFSELERIVAETDYRPEDAELWYDTIVAFGELISTTIISEYLRFAGTPNRWLDMRQCMRTEQRHKDAAVDMEASAPLLRQVMAGADETIFIGQGFIGGGPARGAHSSAGRPTGRLRHWGARGRTIPRRLSPICSTPNRCRCGRMSTVC